MRVVQWGMLFTGEPAHLLFPPAYLLFPPAHLLFISAHLLFPPALLLSPPAHLLFHLPIFVPTNNITRSNHMHQVLSGGVHLGSYVRISILQW